MNLKEHNYAERKDVIIAMLEGVAFYYIGNEIYYDKTSLVPFRFGTSALKYKYRLESCHRWQIEVTWEDGLKDKKILCWVSNYDKDERIKATMIDAFSSGLTRKYASVEGIIFEYAAPVLPNELEHLK